MAAGPFPKHRSLNLPLEGVHFKTDIVLSHKVLEKPKQEAAEPAVK